MIRQIPLIPVSFANPKMFNIWLPGKLLLTVLCFLLQIEPRSRQKCRRNRSSTGAKTRPSSSCPSRCLTVRLVSQGFCSDKGEAVGPRPEIMTALRKLVGFCPSWAIWRAMLTSGESEVQDTSIYPFTKKSFLSVPKLVTAPCLDFSLK